MNVGSVIELLAPYAPISDVTSILKPTQDGQVCALPYKIGNFSWGIYFCNKGYCPTTISSNSTCVMGKFGTVVLSDYSIKSFKLKTKLNGINSTDEQCLIYYYYLSNMTQNSITVIKEEINGNNETIDNVISSPLNGWIKRQVSFFALESNYNIFFDVQKIVGVEVPHASFDEISIHQGNCSEDILINDSTMMTTTEDTTFITSIRIEQSTIESSTILISSSSTVTMTTDVTSTTIFRTTIENLSTVDTTQEEKNSSTASQIILSTQYENSTIMVTSSLIKTSSITITDTLSNDVVPSNKTYIIILATVIPTVVILSIIGIILFKKRSFSKSTQTSVSRTFIDLSKHKKTDIEYELDPMEYECSF